MGGGGDGGGEGGGGSAGAVGGPRIGGRRRRRRRRPSRKWRRRRARRRRARRQWQLQLGGLVTAAAMVPYCSGHGWRSAAAISPMKAAAVGGPWLGGGGGGRSGTGRRRHGRRRRGTDGSFRGDDVLRQHESGTPAAATVAAATAGLAEQEESGKCGPCTVSKNKAEVRLRLEGNQWQGWARRRWRLVAAESVVDANNQPNCVKLDAR